MQNVCNGAMRCEKLVLSQAVNHRRWAKTNSNQIICCEQTRSRSPSTTVLRNGRLCLVCLVHRADCFAKVVNDGDIKNARRKIILFFLHLEAASINAVNRNVPDLADYNVNAKIQFARMAHRPSDTYARPNEIIMCAVNPKYMRTHT